MSGFLLKVRCFPGKVPEKCGQSGRNRRRCGRQRNGSRAAKRKLWAVGNSCSRFSSPGGKQTIGAGTTSEVYSTRLTGGRCEATRKRIFALRPFAPHRLPSPPLRHGMAFRFHCMSNSSTRRAHNMATSCTHKEWTTAVAILSPKRV